MMRFNSLAKRPKHFCAFTGYTIDEFAKLVETVREDWIKQRSARFKPDRIRRIGGGAKLKLPLLEDRLLLFCVYARVYCAYLLLEYLFGVDESTACRIIKEMSPLLSKKIIVQRPGRKISTLKELKELFPDLDEILVDATEQKIPRPQKKRTRNKHHSGKKKAFTVKTQILTDTRGFILHLADSTPGRMHDYKLFKQTAVPAWLNKHPEIRAYGDSGYQGVNKDYPNANFTIPTKRTRAKKELTRSEKIMNTKQRRKRVVVEHAISRLKKFRILGETYRNAKEQYSAIFKSIAFLSNFRLLERQTA
jgi:hypothetical protein